MDAPRSLARDYPQSKAKCRAGLLAENSATMQKVLCTGAAAVESGGSARSGSCCGRGGQGLQGCAREGRLNLLVDDADVVLGATRIQGVR